MNFDSDDHFNRLKLAISFAINLYTIVTTYNLDSLLSAITEKILDSLLVVII